MVHESPWFLIFFFFTYLKNRLRSTKAVPSRLELPADLAVWTIAHRLQWKSKSQVVFPAYAAGTFILLVFFMFLFLILFYTGTDSVYCKIYWICLIGTPIIVARTVGTAFEGFFCFCFAVGYNRRLHQPVRTRAGVDSQRDKCSQGPTFDRQHTW